MEEAFQRVVIDVVGPLRVCSAKRNCFILTLIDHYTHFSFADPLPCHEAAFVARALVDIFSQFGFPTEIMSDNASKFRSTLMKTFVDEFSITEIQTSPYHPATNGSIECFHNTMKNMIRFLSEEFPDAWDETLPWVLFAHREAPVETLGFSPLELMLGCQVNGPLALVKKDWLNYFPTKIKSTKKFVI